MVSDLFAGLIDAVLLGSASDGKPKKLKKRLKIGPCKNNENSKDNNYQKNKAHVDIKQVKPVSSSMKNMKNK